MLPHYGFPTATHTYFRALNKYSQKQAFLEGAIEQPTFTYNPHWTLELIQERMKVVKNDPAATKRLKVVETSLRLRENPDALTAFREANAAIFHAPTKELTEAIIWRISQNVSEPHKEEWDQVRLLLGSEITDGLSISPSEDTFQLYRSYLKRYTTLPAVEDTIKDAFKSQLDSTGLSKKGWKLRVLKGDEHAHIHHHTQTISIGDQYKPRTSTAIRRIVIHEVIGHAIRGPQKELSESEGFAIVLEQLTKSSFAPRRTYRYLAVALGWGVLGKPMTFREVYEILWRLMVVQSKYPGFEAKRHAFDECYRAFRGGRPDIAGAVYLRDTVYFDANIRMWAVLDAGKLSYNEFVDIIEGRRTVL